VSPYLQTLDLDQFFRDMPKYKPWLSSTAWEQWESFQQKKEELLLENPKEQIWNIPRLISAAIVARRELL